MLVACVSCSEKPNDLAVKVAEKALMATVDHPESVKILGFSKADSVFGKNYVTMEERMALSVMMMKINEQVMKTTNNFEDFNPDNREMNELVERQMEAMTTLRALVAFGDIQPEVHGQKKPQAPFSGWKVKVEVEAPNAEGSCAVRNIGSFSISLPNSLSNHLKFPCYETKSNHLIADAGGLTLGNYLL